MSLEELILRHATGAEAPTYEREASAAGVMMIPAPGRGTLAEVRGLERAEAVFGVTAVEITIRPGQRVVPLPEGDRYFGFIFARADSPAAVEAALRKAHAALEFEIEPGRVGAGVGPPGFHIARITRLSSSAAPTPPPLCRGCREERTAPRWALLSRTTLP